MTHDTTVINVNVNAVNLYYTNNLNYVIWNLYRKCC